MPRKMASTLKKLLMRHMQGATLFRFRTEKNYELIAVADDTLRCTFRLP
jgi:hypothetical protein